MTRARILTPDRSLPGLRNLPATTPTDYMFVYALQGAKCLVAEVGFARFGLDGDGDAAIYVDMAKVPDVIAPLLSRHHPCPPMKTITVQVPEGWDPASHNAEVVQ